MICLLENKKNSSEEAILYSNKRVTRKCCCSKIPVKIVSLSETDVDIKNLIRIINSKKKV